MRLCYSSLQAIFKNEKTRAKYSKLLLQLYDELQTASGFFSAFICNCSSLFDLFWKKSMYLHQTKIYSILFYGFSTIQCAIMIPIWFYYAIPVDLLSFTVQDRFICYNDHTSISTQTILSVREQKTRTL